MVNFKLFDHFILFVFILYFSNVCKYMNVYYIRTVMTYGFRYGTVLGRDINRVLNVKI